MKLVSLILFVLLTSSSLVFANWQGWSVWKGNQVAENVVAGQVKTIAIDDEADQLIVKVKTAEGKLAVAKVCHEGVQSAKNQVHGSPKLALLQSAMSSGHEVFLNFSSNYDRCIQDVRVKNPSAPKFRKASAPDEGFKEI